MTRGTWPVLLLALSTALAGPFGGGSGPFGSGSAGTATTTVAGVQKIRPTTIEIASVAASLGAVTNIPAAPTELFGLAVNRKPFDATNYTEFRLVGRQGVASSAGSEACGVFSTDGGATFTYLDGTSTAAACDTSLGFVSLATGANTSFGEDATWRPLAAGARSDSLFTVYTDDGDGVADPTISIGIQLR